MTRKCRWFIRLVICIYGFANMTISSVSAEPRMGLVQVAKLIYSDGKTAECFSEGFLLEVSRTTDINIDKRLHTVPLNSEKIYQYPFLIMAGTGKFVLSDLELKQLQDYLERGGFLLASSACSDTQWADSFNIVIQSIFEKTEYESIDLEHPIFHMLYDIDRLPTRQGGEPGKIYGIWSGGQNSESHTRGGRLAVLFSPTGLNDTDKAGGGCCCCGGNELMNAKHINANILVYVLTH